MTNLRCTADQHAVSPLNIRPVESGIIPDHFSTGWKTYPAHHDLSDRARPIPAVFQTNIRSPRSRPAHCRSVHFSRAGESGGWSGLWCERAFRLKIIEIAIFHRRCGLLLGIWSHLCLPGVNEYTNSPKRYCCWHCIDKNHKVNDKIFCQTLIPSLDLLLHSYTFFHGR